MQYTPPTNQHSKGFTLIEVLIVSPIVILAIGAFIGAIVFLTGEALIARASNTMTYELQNALDTIERDVNLSGAFLSENNITLVSPQGRDDATGVFNNAIVSGGETEHALILNTFATSSNPSDVNRELVYLNNSPNACGSALESQNTLFTVNVVYFIKDNALWRRTILPQNYDSGSNLCASSWQVPSCSELSTPFCKTRDEKLLTGISASGFSIEYYTSPSPHPPVTAAADPSLSATERQDELNKIRTVRVTLTATVTVAGREISRSNSLNATRINSLYTTSTPSFP